MEPLSTDSIRRRINQVDPRNLHQWALYLAADPLPFRTLNRTIPGHEKCTLYEADDYIEGKLRHWGWSAERDSTSVQVYRRDETKNIHHQYSPPDPGDPWYVAHNILVQRTGSEAPEDEA